jgi:glutamate dehydrogenase
VQVVGEGGNLGFTQEARIEFALAGGRINTDAIDNSGGVDLSDREVNLKILLGSVVAASEITLERRNELLRELQDPVAELVLQDNEAQSMAVSLDELRAREGVDDLRDLMAGLERTGSWTGPRSTSPPGKRWRSGRRWGRPSPAPSSRSCWPMPSGPWPTSHSSGAPVPEDPAARYLRRLLPPPRALQVAGERGGGPSPPREIVASQLTNELVAIMGAGFIHRVSRGTGRSTGGGGPGLARGRPSSPDHDAVLDWLRMGGTCPSPWRTDGSWDSPGSWSGPPAGS